MKHFSIHRLSKTHTSLLTKVSDSLCCGNLNSVVFFYHSDHLGSASWITNKTGTPVQHLQYMPYGEPFVNERTSSYEERFTFTGKERDSETGFSYFGARYYDSDILTGWLSVDPMADKYPNLSPYAYCGWNPIKLVDPDGNEQGIPPYLIGYLMENYGKSNTIKELGFIIRDPYIGYKIGKYSPNSKNISTIASNFEINICRASNLERGNPGDYGNAIRHTLWQSIICNEFGTDIATRVGNVHESGKSSSLTTINRIFKGDFGKESADQVADLLNNAIGREIATNNVGLSNKKYAEKVIERFYTKGLYVVKSDGENHSVQLVKLTKQQYESAIQEIKKLKEYGKEN